MKKAKKKKKTEESSSYFTFHYIIWVTEDSTVSKCIGSINCFSCVIHVPCIYLSYNSHSSSVYAIYRPACNALLEISNGREKKQIFFFFFLKSTVLSRSLAIWNVQ